MTKKPLFGTGVNKIEWVKNVFYLMVHFLIYIVDKLENQFNIGRTKT